MIHAPTDLIHRLKLHNQEHTVAQWVSLSSQQRAELIANLAAIDFAELESLFARKAEAQSALPPREQIAPLPVEPAACVSQMSAMGEAALRSGEVAVLLVAGGQGTRLGFDKPKGLFPVGPISGASLFQIHAEKVLAISRRYKRPVPFLVMTSHATHDETVTFFREHSNFGLNAEQVHFFQQGTMPAVDLASGKLLMESPGKIFLSPNGHGGTLTALADSGLLAELKEQGIQHIFYFQVDNPLVQIAEPGFLGKHIAARSEVSSKVVFKELPEEKVGVLAQVNGRCGIIEYSDMPKAMNEERAPDGTLAFRAGNPAIHIFGVPFLERVSSGAERLNFHVAKKKVPYWDGETGRAFTPTTENALKFELFIFDALPLADRWLAVETHRADEFAPLKNATGADSLQTCQALQVAHAKRWLENAGVQVAPGVVVEISPLFALDEQELKQRITPGEVVNSPKYFA